MVYQNNFVVAIKCDGKILREIDGVVRLPFGSEYSIFMKNLDSRNVVVSVDIDGENVSDGRVLINAYSTFELKGRIKNLVVDRKFKFIEKTDVVRENREDRVDDGIIRIEYQYENNYNYPLYAYSWYTPPVIYKYNSPNYTGIVEYTSGGYTINCSVNNNVSNDEGITGDGSDTKQDFIEKSVYNLENTSHVITIKLKGKKDDVVVQKPVFSRDKLKCSICGRVSKSSFKYCPFCGNRL